MFDSENCRLFFLLLAQFLKATIQMVCLDGFGWIFIDIVAIGLISNPFASMAWAEFANHP